MGSSNSILSPSILSPSLSLSLFQTCNIQNCCIPQGLCWTKHHCTYELQEDQTNSELFYILLDGERIGHIKIGHKYHIQI